MAKITTSGETIRSTSRFENRRRTVFAAGNAGEPYALPATPATPWKLSQRGGPRTTARAALVPYVIRMMMAIQRSRRNAAAEETAVREYFALAGDFKDLMSRPCKPWFVGVWDTVSSVGWIENPLKLPFVANNPDIAIGRHAIAIDERRAFFRNHFWRAAPNPSEPSGPRDVQQVWRTNRWRASGTSPSSSQRSTSIGRRARRAGA